MQGGETAMSAPEIITYDGVQLSSAVPGISIIDFEIGAMDIENALTDRNGAAGADFTERRLGTRIVQITVELPFEHDTFFTNYGLLRTWGEKAVPKALTFSSIPGRRLMALSAAFPSLTQKTWYNPILFTMTVPDGYFEQTTPSTANTGTQFTVQGDGPVWPTITHNVSSALTDPQWTIGGKVVKVMGSFSSGTIIIDTARRLATHNGIAQRVSLLTRYQQLQKGQQTIYGPAGGVITWNERWL
jgi:phage-related protein